MPSGRTSPRRAEVNNSGWRSWTWQGSWCHTVWSITPNWGPGLFWGTVPDQSRNSCPVRKLSAKSCAQLFFLSSAQSLWFIFFLSYFFVLGLLLFVFCLLFEIPSYYKLFKFLLELSREKPINKIKVDVSVLQLDLSAHGCSQLWGPLFLLCFSFWLISVVSNSSKLEL